MYLHACIYMYTHVFIYIIHPADFEHPMYDRHGILSTENKWS